MTTRVQTWRPRCGNVHVTWTKTRTHVDVWPLLQGMSWDDVPCRAASVGRCCRAHAGNRPALCAGAQTGQRGRAISKKNCMSPTPGLHVATLRSHGHRNRGRLHVEVPASEKFALERGCLRNTRPTDEEASIQSRITSNPSCESHEEFRSQPKASRWPSEPDSPQ